MNKRGYGFSAPVVAVAIGILILVYLYFLPVNDKCNLIPGLAMCGPGEAEKIVSMSPGLLIPQEVSKRYSIPNIELFRIDDIDIATLLEGVEVKRGWFLSDAREAWFSAPSGAKEAKLFIFVDDAKGSLNVIVNGMTIARVRGNGVKEVVLPLGILKENNQIKLSSSIPFMPWSFNSHSISKVILKESYTKTTNQASYNIELKQDIHDIQKGTLDFNSECFSDDNMTITINGNRIINDKICNGFSKDIEKYLKMNNTIVFMTDGNYLINDAYIDVTTKDQIWPTYYFDMPLARLQGKMPIMLNLHFNETGNKELSVYINGISISAQTTKLDWKTTINRFLFEGQNSMMFVPKTEVTIGEAEVR